MSKTLYGDAFIAMGMTYVDAGTPDELHQIFDWAVEHGAKATVTNQHPLNVHQRVLNALDRDERFEKSYITYPGIMKHPARLFKLKGRSIDGDDDI